MKEKMLTRESFHEVRRWMYRNARPLELARWQHWFEGGSVKAVLTALAAYQNEDGGFGHALEADCWNPCSTPIQTGDALLLLDQLGFEEGEHPMVRRVLRWLESGACRREGYWMNTVPQNDSYPHAPWWSYRPESGVSFNPTGILLGFLLRYGERESAAYQEGLATANVLLRACEKDPPADQHSLTCCLALLRGIRKAGLWEALQADTALKAVLQKAGEMIERDTGKWDGYVCLPSVFIDGPDSPLYPGNEAVLAQELEMLIAKREPGGVWGISWQWGSCPEAFAISENWWKGRKAVESVQLLKNFGLMEE